MKPEHQQWIDRDKRNYFKGGTGASTIKCACKYNYYRYRNAVINEELCRDKYLRCNELEDWQHVILCPVIAELKK